MHTFYLQKKKRIIQNREILTEKVQIPGENRMKKFFTHFPQHIYRNPYMISLFISGIVDDIRKPVRAHTMYTP